MVSVATRKVTPVFNMSDSTITNTGRISPPPGAVAMTPPSEEEEENELEDEAQPLPPPPSIATSTMAIPPRSLSNGTAISSLTVDSGIVPANTEANTQGSSIRSNDSGLPMQVPQPTSFSAREARDVSASSRDSLRLQVNRRKMSLTASEQSYLDHLAAHGDEHHVQLAFERLQDDELFFDHTTPRHYKGQPLFFDDQIMVLDRAVAPTEAEPDDRRPTLERMASSQRRLLALAQRRNSIQHLTLWRAHQSGLAVTANGSRKSLVRRSTSNSNGGSSSGSLPRPPTSAAEIFRRQQQQQRQRQTSSSSSSAAAGGPGRVSFLPPKKPLMVPPRLHQRSQSLLVPGIPPPQRMQRRSSTNSSRKSVTFHEETDGTPKPKVQRKLLRRSVSDTAFLTSSTTHISTAPVHEEEGEDVVKNEQGEELVATCHPSMVERQESTSSIPSIHHAYPIRQDSVSSIPSLHHAHPIRQDSISSIPSLHHAHPIRQDSVSSIPSLHHAHPIRQDSVASIPSLHHGHPIRQDSISSIPSLHHGHPLLDESSSSASVRLTSDVMSIPSLHHGTLLMDESSSSYNSGGVAGTMQRMTSNDIANAWLLQQQQGEPLQAERVSSLGSLPHDVTFPTVTTEDTYPSTAATEPTADSTTVYGALSDDDDPANPATATTIATTTTPGKPVLMRLASRNAYEGEGVEVTELRDQSLQEDEMSEYHNTSSSSGMLLHFPAMISMDASIRTCNSWDTAISSYQQHPEIFRGFLPKSLSEDDQFVGSIYLGSGANLLLKDNSDRMNNLWNEKRVSAYEDDASWDMNSDSDVPRYDSWNVLKDEYVNGYGGGGSLDFLILGTDADDEAAQPHVLSPPLMESLQGFLPLTKSGQNFFLKYSMVRDGASLHTFLKRARGVQYSILALETVDGEVFGSFTGQPWRKNWNYFGTGESFLWRMRRSRLEKTHDILEQAHLESEIDVFPYTGENRFIQLCTHDRIAVGGGTPSEKKTENDEEAPLMGTFVQPHEWGFGLSIDSELLTGTSSPCVTFGSPSLSNMHSDGTRFEIVNMELWTLTPCMTVSEAEKLELGKLFLERD